MDSLDESEKGNCLDLPSWQGAQTDVLLMESLTGRENLEITRRRISGEGWPRQQCQMEVRALTLTVIVRA